MRKDNLLQKLDELSEAEEEFVTEKVNEIKKKEKTGSKKKSNPKKKIVSRVPIFSDAVEM